MGKSTASCFRIITCGSDPVDHDDLQAPKSKVSSGRNGWSFRKTSTKHQVSSNTVILEAPSAADEESLESTAANFHVQPNFPEKTPVIQWTEQKDNLSPQTDSNLSGIVAAKEDNYSADASLHESSVNLIQAAIRGYLARRALLKQRSATKLQAAIRGHLVRWHAVGTLRCVQAIVKVQALVRAHRACLLVEGLGDFEKQKSNTAKDNLNPTVLMGKREAKPNGTYTCTSIEKLLSSKFARKLLESTPRTKPVNIKCDPSKSDEAWKWLEIWTSASYNEEPVKSLSTPEQHPEENLGYSSVEGVILLPSGIRYESEDFLGPSAETSDNDENLITFDADSLHFHACSSVPPSMSHPHLQNMCDSNSRHDFTESSVVKMKETHLMSKVDTKSLPFKDETRNGQPLIAVSECGTELSITSTLDSPDMSGGVDDLEAHEIVHSLSGEGVDTWIVSDSSSRSQATPSSKVSLNPKKSRGKISGLSLEKRSLSAVKREEVQKEDKTVKRRNSFGSAKLDQEPRDSISSSSLPSYMQATESAKAKAVSNGSTRSSPDVQDNAIFTKNRPSLHGKDGKQGSRHIHRSPSQPKGNDIHSPQERKWRR